MTHSVIYRKGGTLACSWHRLLTNFATINEAEAKRDEIRRMGYHAEVRDTRTLDKIGLPIGWNHQSVDWETDRYTAGRYETTWRKGSDYGR